MAANAQIILSLQTQAAPQLAQLAGGTKALTVAQLAQVTAAQRLETQTQKTALASQRLQTEEQKTAAQTANTARAQDAASLSALRLQQAQEKAASGSNTAARFADSLKGSLLSIVGPAAAAAAAIGAIKGVADSFKEAFTFKAQLDATTLAIQTNLEGVRNSGQVFSQAAQFADRYRLTQKETNDILASSTDILRVSTAGVGELESSLLRLQSRDVSKPISEAARALRELNSGDVTSIKELFNVPAREALRMKNEIAAGGDAVKVLNGYLDRAGVGMGVLENRAKGAAGAINEQAIAAERLALAQAQFAQGPGITITKLQTTGLDTLTADLQGRGNDVATANQLFVSTLAKTGDFTAALDARATSLNATYQAQVAAAAGLSAMTSRVKDDLVGVSAATAAATDATRVHATAYDEDRVAAGRAQLATTDKANADKLAAVNAQTHAIAEKQIDDAAQGAAQAMLANGAAGVAEAARLRASADPIQERIVAYYDLQRAALAAATAENAASVAKTVATNRATGRSSGREGGSDFAADTAASVAATKAQTAEQEKHLDAEIALAAAKKDTGRQIDLLRQKEKLFGKDADDRTSIEAQIISLQSKGDTSRTSALNKQLGLQESIYDSINKQKDALLDIEELTIRDRQQDRLDADKVAQAQRIINSPRASAEFKARAQDVIDLADVQNRKREQELIEKGATAGGTIGPNGRVLQSVVGGGTAPQTGAIGAIPPPPTRVGGPTQPGGTPVTVNVYLGDEQLIPKFITVLHNGLDQSNNAGARTP